MNKRCSFSRIVGFSISSLILTAGSALGQEISSINSDRPGQTFSSIVLAKRQLTLQFGIETYWDGSMDQYLHTNPVQFRYGLLNNLEITASFFRNHMRKIGPGNDFDIGVRYQIIDFEKIHMNFMGRFGTQVLPFLDDNVPTTTFLINLGVDVGDISFGTSSGVKIYGPSGDFQSGSSIYTTLNVGYNPNPRFSIYSDFNLVANPNQLFSSTTSQTSTVDDFFESSMIQLGMSYQLSRILRLDLNLGSDGWVSEYSSSPGNGQVKVSIAHTSIGLTLQLLEPKK